jgi:hypothetical protein
MQKTTFLGAAAIALMAATSAHAQSGFVGLSYQSSDDTNIDTIALSGSVAAGANFQLDGRYASLEASGGGGSSIDAWNVGGHLFSRGEQWLWGGYIGFNTLDVGGGFSVDDTTFALETQYFMARTTFSGALGYTTSDLFGADLKQTALDLELRHFVSDNFSIQGNVGFGNVDGGGGSDADVSGYGIGAEAQLGSAPVSIYGGFQHAELDGGSGVDSIGIGARWNFGGSLFDRNRSGAGLNRPSNFIDHFFGELSPR